MHETEAAEPLKGKSQEAGKEEEIVTQKDQNGMPLYQNGQA